MPLTHWNSPCWLSEWIARWMYTASLYIVESLADDLDYTVKLEFEKKRLGQKGPQYLKKQKTYYGKASWKFNFDTYIHK